MNLKSNCLVLTMFILGLMTNKVLAEENREFCEKFPENTRCEKVTKLPVKAREITITGDWRNSKINLPWSELVYIKSNFASEYAIFDRNYRKSGGWLSLGTETGFITKFTQDEINLFVYYKTGCDAILGCRDVNGQAIGNYIEVLIGSKIYRIYGDQGNFVVSPELKSVFREIEKNTPVQIKINNVTVNTIGRKTVANLSALYSIPDDLENNQITEKISLVSALPDNYNVQKIVANTVPSVVNIETPFGKGTGFIISNTGLILTNRHVVSRTLNPQITLFDGTKIEGKVLKRDSLVDIALLQINTNSELKSLPLCYQQYPSVGEEVLAIGNAQGLSNTVTRGIVSGIRQTDNQTLIQTDAPINPGNSGGPLLNKYGEVLGIVNAKISSSGIEGLGFAISTINALETLALKLNIPNDISLNSCGNPFTQSNTDNSEILPTNIESMNNTEILPTNTESNDLEK